MIARLLNLKNHNLDTLGELGESKVRNSVFVFISHPGGHYHAVLLS